MGYALKLIHVFPKNAHIGDIVRNTWISFSAVVIVYLPHLYPRSVTAVNILGSQKCVLILHVPKTWFKNWPGDDYMSRNMSPHL